MSVERSDNGRLPEMDVGADGCLLTAVNECAGGPGLSETGLEIAGANFPQRDGSHSCKKRSATLPLLFPFSFFPPSLASVAE